MGIAGLKRRALARRLYISRTLGLVLGLLCVGVAVYPLNPANWVWVLMLLYAVAWPYLAYQRVRRAKVLYLAEHRNLLVDAFLGCFWIAAMQFNPLPTATIVSMMAMNNMAIGGIRFLATGAVAQLLGLGVGCLVFGPVFIVQTSQAQLYACLPLLCLYPLALGWICYRQAFTLRQHTRELLALSRTDSLTGLLNHGAWKDELDVEFLRCQQEHQGSTIALIDIDHFKVINDTYGHVAGDAVLRQLSKLLKQVLGAGDLAGRYGGDEFCVILPDLPLSTAAASMEALRDRFATLAYEQNPELKVSLSIGLAAFSPHHTDAILWLNDADLALYAAKTTGRNRVICSDDGRPYEWLSAV